MPRCRSRDYRGGLALRCRLRAEHPSWCWFQIDEVEHGVDDLEAKMRERAENSVFLLRECASSGVDSVVDDLEAEALAVTRQAARKLARERAERWATTPVPSAKYSTPGD